MGASTEKQSREKEEECKVAFHCRTIVMDNCKAGQAFFR
jgi:hypothetical protein